MMKVWRRVVLAFFECATGDLVRPADSRVPDALPYRLLLPPGEPSGLRVFRTKGRRIGDGDGKNALRLYGQAFEW